MSQINNSLQSTIATLEMLSKALEKAVGASNGLHLLEKERLLKYCRVLYDQLEQLPTQKETIVQNEDAIQKVDNELKMLREQMLKELALDANIRNPLHPDLQNDDDSNEEIEDLLAKSTIEFERNFNISEAKKISNEDEHAFESRENLNGSIIDAILEEQDALNDAFEVNQFVQQDENEALIIALDDADEALLAKLQAEEDALNDEADALMDALELEKERKEEAERLIAQQLADKKAQTAKEEAERLIAQQLADEKAQIAKEEAERLIAQQLADEKAQIAKEEAERLIAQQLADEKAQIAKEEAERLIAQQLADEKAQIAKEEAERLIAQQLADEKAQIAKEEAERLIAQQLADEKAQIAKEEAERLIAQQLADEKAQIAKEEAEREKENLPLTFNFETNTQNNVAEKLNIIELLKNCEGSTFGSLKLKPIPNLKSGISLNEKFLFIRELFGNDPTKFMQTIQEVNDATDLDSAQKILSSGAYTTHKWQNNDEVVIEFLKLVYRRFV